MKNNKQDDKVLKTVDGGINIKRAIIAGATILATTVTIGAIGNSLLSQNNTDNISNSSTQAVSDFSSDDGYNTTSQDDNGGTANEHTNKEQLDNSAEKPEFRSSQAKAPNGGGSSSSNHIAYLNKGGSSSNYIKNLGGKKPLKKGSQMFVNETQTITYNHITSHKANNNLNVQKNMRSVFGGIQGRTNENKAAEKIQEVANKKDDLKENDKKIIREDVLENKNQKKTNQESLENEKPKSLNNEFIKLKKLFEEELQLKNLKKMQYTSKKYTSKKDTSKKDTSKKVLKKNMNNYTNKKSSFNYKTKK